MAEADFRDELLAEALDELRSETKARSESDHLLKKAVSEKQAVERELEKLHVELHAERETRIRAEAMAAALNDSAADEADKAAFIDTIIARVRALLDEHHAEMKKEMPKREMQKPAATAMMPPAATPPQYRIEIVSRDMNGDIKELRATPVKG